MVGINAYHVSIVFGSSLSNGLIHITAAAEDDLGAIVVPAINESLQLGRGGVGVTILPGVVQLNGLAHLSGSSIGALSEAVTIANASGVGAAAAAGEAELFKAFLNNSVTGQVAALLLGKDDTGNISADRTAINKEEGNIGILGSDLGESSFLQEAALTKIAAEYPDVAFFFVDGGSVGANVAGIVFAEEQCGYLAGYAVVKEGFEKLGFTGGGGGTNPACVRYGYGFAQGANAAAAEMGKTVELNYTWQYGNSYSPSSELQALVNGWYNNGTEVIFCCGGNMYQSVAQAAAENDAYMVGVDTDQSPLSETIITSAMKGLSDGVQWGLAYVFEGSFADIAGKSTTLSAKENAVGLPTATWSLKNFTVEQYQAELAKIVNGEITVDNNSEMSNPEKAELSNVKVNFVG